MLERVDRVFILFEEFPVNLSSYWLCFLEEHTNFTLLCGSININQQYGNSTDLLKLIILFSKIVDILTSNLGNKDKLKLYSSSLIKLIFLTLHNSVMISLGLIFS